MFDVIIVGGGPAGLSAALVLGRCRRHVLVCDAGNPRNAPSKAMHGFLSRDGIPPCEFLEICREQLRQYPDIEVRSGTVVSAQRGEGQFKVTLENGQTETARMLLLAMGIADELPVIDGFHRFYGTTVHHCPYCDGWEHRDAPLAVYGRTMCEVELAIELLGWSRDLVLCTNGNPTFDDAAREKLACLKIRVIETPVAALEGEGDRLAGIRFRDGSFVKCEAMFFSPIQKQRSGLAHQLGCELNADGAIECGETAATCIPGLYVAGNASRGLQLVIMAAAEGTQAAFTMNQALLEADAECEAANQRTSPQP